MFKFSRITAEIAAILVAFFIINPVTARTPEFQLEKASIADINKAFDAGVLTAEKLVQLYLERIATYEDGEPKLNSITKISPKALEVAIELDKERKSKEPRSPLHGVVLQKRKEW